MGVLTVLEGKLGLEVLLEKRVLADGLHKSRVDGLLVSLAGSGAATVLVTLVLGGLEVGVVELLQVRGADVHLGGGGDDVAGVDAAERDAVNAVRASDEEEAGLVHLLEDDGVLATELALEQDGNGARGKGLAQLLRLVL